MSTTNEPLEATHSYHAETGLDAALAAANLLGWRVFPVHSFADGACSCGRADCDSPGKHPRTRTGLKEATIDGDQIRAWWGQWPDAGVGLATGEVSGVWVLDVDPDKGGEASMVQLQDEVGVLRPALESITGGGGRHLFWCHPEDLDLGNRTGFLAGLDVRGDGGYVILPPSSHRSGRRYEWDGEVDLRRVYPTHAPEALLERVTWQDRRARELADRFSDGEPIPEGERNDTFFRMGCSMRAHGFTEGEILLALEEANHRPGGTPLSDRDVQTLARQAGKYEPSTAAAMKHKGVAVADLREGQVDHVTYPLPVRLPSLPAVPEYDNQELTPPVMQQWVADMARRFQLPLEFFAVAAIVSVTGLIGRRLGIRPKVRDDWQVIPNLWGGIVGPASAGKTPALSECLGPVQQLSRELNQEYAKKRRESECEFEAEEKARKLVDGAVGTVARSSAKKVLEKKLAPDLEEEIEARIMENLPADSPESGQQDQSLERANSKQSEDPEESDADGNERADDAASDAGEGLEECDSEGSGSGETRLERMRNVIASVLEELTSQITSAPSDGDEPRLEPEKRLLVNDATWQKLQDIMVDNPQGLILFRDEFTAILVRLARPGNEEERKFLLECWSGDGEFRVDRIGREGRLARGLCLAVIGGFQPDPLRAHLVDIANTPEGNDGLLQRFQMLVWPDIPCQYELVDDWPDWDARKRVLEAFRRIQMLDPISAGAETDSFRPGSPPFLRFAEDAQDVFNRWLTDLMQRVRSGHLHPAMQSHLGKYPSLVPSLALAFQLLEDASAGSVSLPALERAVAWARFLEGHAQRVYWSVCDPRQSAARLLAGHLLKGDLEDVLTVRDVYRKEWSGLRGKDQVLPAVEMLVELGWLQAAEKTTGRGRSTERYKSNPRIHELDPTTE